MHPYIQHQLTGTRIAEMRSQAERHRMARMARSARRATQRPAGQRIAGPGSVLHRVCRPCSPPTASAGSPARLPRRCPGACVREGLPGR